MNKHTTFEIVAFVSAIMSALISAILLGIVCSFMIVTRDQQQEVHAIRSDYTVLKAKIQPMIANNVYTLCFSYDVNDEHLEQDVTVRVK